MSSPLYPSWAGGARRPAEWPYARRCKSPVPALVWRSRGLRRSPRLSEGSQGPSTVSFLDGGGACLCIFQSPPKICGERSGRPRAPLIVDVRKPEAVAASNGLLPGAILRDPHDAASWSFEHDPGTIVVACVHGHQRSQMAAAQLRARGLDARILEGGTDAWHAAGLPLVDCGAVQRFAPNPPSLWVTRRRPKIDRIACPWLIRRFIDPQARFLFVDPPQVRGRRTRDRRDTVRYRRRGAVA